MSKKSGTKKTVETLGRDGEKWKQTLVRIIVLSALAWFAPAPFSAGPLKAEPPSRPSFLVPSYFYPAGDGLKAWRQLTDDARTITIEAILDPASGPGERRDPAYVSVVSSFRKAGGRILGYIPTSYAKRAIADIESDLRSYLKFYEMDGVFLDEMAGSKQSLAYYLKIHDLIKDLKPEFRIVGNPGQPVVDEGFMKAVDCLVLFEGTAAGYAVYNPQLSTPWMVRYPPSRFANIIHTVATPAEMRRAMEKARTTRADWVFVTNRLMPNPYDGLPHYWTEEIRALELTTRKRPGR